MSVCVCVRVNRGDKSVSLTAMATTATIEQWRQNVSMLRTEDYSTQPDLSVAGNARLGEAVASIETRWGMALSQDRTWSL